MDQNTSMHHIIDILKGAISLAGSFLLTNYNAIAGGVLTTLLIAYHIWKWRQDYLKSKIK